MFKLGKAVLIQILSKSSFNIFYGILGDIEGPEMRDIEGIFLDILLPQTKLIIDRIIERLPNKINFLECFEKHRMTRILIIKYFSLVNY